MESIICPQARRIRKENAEASSDSGENIPGRIHLNKGAAFEKHGEQMTLQFAIWGYPIGFKNNAYLPLRQWVQKNLVESVIDRWFLPTIEHDSWLVFLALRI